MRSFAEYERLRGELALEEFRQMNEYLRQSQDAMYRIVNVSVTGCATLLAATFVLATKDPTSASTWKAQDIAYIFTLPILIVSLSLRLLDAHRHDIYRIQYYIQVFFKEPFEFAAGWGKRSFLFRSKLRGESLDSLTTVYGAICLLSTLLAIVFAKGDLPSLQTIMVILGVFWIAFIINCSRFSRERTLLEAQWKKVRGELGE